jgi:hypothetical protein
VAVVGSCVTCADVARNIRSAGDFNSDKINGLKALAICETSSQAFAMNSINSAAASSLDSAGIEVSVTASGVDAAAGVFAGRPRRFFGSAGAGVGSGASAESGSVKIVSPG